jgi:hypothetical protein
MARTRSTNLTDQSTSVNLPLHTNFEGVTGREVFLAGLILQAQSQTLRTEPLSA